MRGEGRAFGFPIRGGFTVARADTLVRHVASGDVSALACVRIDTGTFPGVPDTTVAAVDSWISETTTSQLGAGALTLRASSLVLDPDCDRVAEPSALDLDAAAEPLRVTHEAGSLGFTWQDVGVERYDIHRGTVAAVHGGIYDHSRTAACGVTATAASLTDDPGSFYFLVTGRIRALASSYGRDSLGRERDVGLVICP